MMWKLVRQVVPPLHKTILFENDAVIVQINFTVWYKKHDWGVSNLKQSHAKHLFERN